MYNMSGHLPLLQVNALKAPLTKTFFQNYWWSHNWQSSFNVNMVVVIFLLMDMTSILLTFSVPIEEFSTFCSERGTSLRGTPSHLTKLSYVFLWQLYCIKGMSLYAWGASMHLLLLSTINTMRHHSAFINKRPKGPHIVHPSTMCHLFRGIGQGGHFCLLIGLNNTNMVVDIEILLPVKFHWIPFSGFRGEVKNIKANQRPGWPSCFLISMKNTNLVEDVKILLPVKFCWIPFSSFRGRKCLSQSEVRAAILFFRSARKTQTW